MTQGRHVAVVGGGLFGLTAAILLAEEGNRVTVLEQCDDTMQCASLVNQNRVHRGYHYPRSILTAEESLRGLMSFRAMYGRALVQPWRTYYAIRMDGSRVNADYFSAFCTSIGLELIKEFPPSLFLNDEGIERVWRVNEGTLSLSALRHLVSERVRRLPSLTVRTNARVVGIDRIEPYVLRLLDGEVVRADAIVNATYAGIGSLERMAGIPPLPRQFELCVMPIMRSDLDVPDIGVTVMDGGFGSIMPEGGSPGRYILYHVVESVVENAVDCEPPCWTTSGKLSWAASEVVEACAELFPVIKRMRCVDIRSAVRVVPAGRDQDDARPTIIRQHSSSFFSILSGKLSTCVDAARTIATNLGSPA